MILLAITPILVVLVGMLVLKKPAMIVAPIAMVFTVILATVAFNGTVENMLPMVSKGFFDGLKIIFLIWSAFTMLMMMQETKAMDKIKDVISGLTDDRRIQVIIIAFCLGIFLEGAAGAGTPAAICAPFLIGLGFTPLSAAAAALISNSVPVSWGGAGVTTIAGSAPVANYMTVAQSSAMVGRIHMIGGFLVPILLIYTIFGKKGFKKLWGFLIYIGLVICGSVFIFSNFIGPEVTSLGTGTISIIASVIYVKVFKTETLEEFRYIKNENSQSETNINALQAFSPYLLLLILLPVVRFSFPLSTLAKYGYTVWVGAVIFGVVFIGSIILNSTKKYFSYAKDALVKVIPALIAMCSLLILAMIMNKTGMIPLIATTLSSIAGNTYPFMAVAIGALGSFMTGTGLGSNIMFGPMHVQAATSLNLNPITIFAGQNSGAAIGNMICPNNVVATATTVRLLGKEGDIMMRVFPAFFALLAVYGMLAILYTIKIFPMFGM